MEHRISKSSYLSGMQCPKRLWCERLRPELVSPPTADQRQRLDQGHEVGELAQRLFPNGLLIEGELEFESHLRKSRDALQLRIPLFEPALAIEGAYARADILNPVGDCGWELIEVKSSSNVWEDKSKTKFKQVYLYDIAFQLYVLQQAGIEIERCVLLAINSDYVRRGDISAGGLFRTHEVTDQVRAMQEAVPNEIRKYLAVLSSSIVPDIGIGAHCEKPYSCGVISHCWREVPGNSVHSLYRIGAKADELWKRGIRTISDLPADFRLTARQQIQVNQERENKPLIDRAGIRKFLDGLVFPISFLDFESFQLAVPPFDGCRPYTQIPFQYSLHVMEGPTGALTHLEFLADAECDPRGVLLEKLRDHLPKSGSIVTYNSNFERSRMEEMAASFPEHSEWINASIPRLNGADLLVLFREFSYYDPRQCGSASIKSVLPVITDVSYSGLAIADGATAASEFTRISRNAQAVSDAAITRERLREYCSKDTMAMVQIFRSLQGLVGEEG